MNRSKTIICRRCACFLTTDDCEYFYSWTIAGDLKWTRKLYSNQFDTGKWEWFNDESRNKYYHLHDIIGTYPEQVVKTGTQDDVRCDVRLFTKYFSILINSDGNACVVKGTGSFYIDSLIIKSADTSSVFKLDSARVFFEDLNKIRSKPIFKENRSTGTAQRCEVYFKQVKVFDDYAFDPGFWDLFRPIMTQVPKAYNPFIVDNWQFHPAK